MPPREAFCCDDDVLSVPSHGHRETPLVLFNSVGELYDKIRAAVKDIPLSDAELFIGPPTAQVSGYALHVNFPRIGALGGVWDVTLFPVTDRKSAFKAIDLIIEQGEGTPRHDEFTHYKYFRHILEDLQELKAKDPSVMAGPSFETNRTIHLLPHRLSAWTVLDCTFKAGGRPVYRTTRTRATSRAV